MYSSVVQTDHQEHKKWIKMKDMHTVIEAMPADKNILFSDNKTKLLDCISSMDKLSTLQKFLQDIPDVNASLPEDSPLWPGSTPLHLAVMFSEKMRDEYKVQHLFQQFLSRGASVQVQNNRGATPLHLAFRFEQQQIAWRVVTLFLRSLGQKPQKVVNLVDNENLSLLHIFCAHYVITHAGLAKELLNQPGIESTVNVAYEGKALANVKEGWTPLHVAVDQRAPELVRLLLQRGASTACKDAQGYTAIHQLFGTTVPKSVVDLLFASEQLTDCAAERDGLTYLHVAVWFDDAECVERLLNLGADIEATLVTVEDGRPTIKPDAGCTPLHLAMILQHSEIVRILLRRGADILARHPNGVSPLSKALTGRHTETACSFVNLIWSDDRLQKRLEEELGLTILHIACCNCDLRQVEEALEKGTDVNARLHDHSNFWAGCTPLHLLIAADAFSFTDKKMMVLKKLVQINCDVNQQDNTGKTALLLAVTSSRHQFFSYAVKYVPVFLSAGADINILDCSGKSVISYVLDFYSRCWDRWILKNVNPVVLSLLLHVWKMKLVGIEASERDETLAYTALRKHNVSPHFARQSVFLDQVLATENVKIGRRGLSLRSFLSETGAVSLYPSLTPADRDELAAFFRSFDDQKFREVIPLLKLQYRKAVARLSLIGPARDALKSFMCSGFPDLCVDLILKYLSNSQLKQLIKESVEDTEA